MSGRFRSRAVVALVGAALALLLTFVPVPASAQEEPEELDSINANSTGEPGVFHVTPVFRDLEVVQIFKRGGPYGREHSRYPEKGREWTFDASTGRLEIRVPVDPETDFVSVRGRQVVPWRWRVRFPIEEGTVRVLLGERPGVRGVDFEADEAKGEIRFLKPELCDRRKDYFVCWKYHHPDLPGRLSTGSVGGHGDRDLVRRFTAGEPIGTPPAAGKTMADLVGLDHINALQTGTPGVFHLSPVFRTIEAVRIITKGGPYGEEHTRKPDVSRDCSYDPATGALRVDPKAWPVDRDREMLIVYGPREMPWAWNFGEPLEEGSVEVFIDDRVAVRGVDFEADEAQSRVWFLKEELCRKGVLYYIGYGHPPKAGEPDAGRGGAIGSMDRATVRRLRGQKGSPPRDRPTATVGTNALPTDDARLWRLARPMRAEGLTVGIVPHENPQAARWLAHGTDYWYDGAKGILMLRAGLVVDPEKEILFVSGAHR